MECPSCGKDMFKMVRTNGGVFLFCPVCNIEKETKDLAPPFYENEVKYKDEA